MGREEFGYIIPGYICERVVIERITKQFLLWDYFNNQFIESAWMSNKGYMNKNAWYLYIIDYYSAIKNNSCVIDRIRGNYLRGSEIIVL